MSARCATCGTLIAEGAEVHTCPACDQSYHVDCWAEVGGCATYGCTSAPVADKAPPPIVVGAGWGDHKTCPGCGASIASSLLVCRCGANFPYADPMTGEEWDSWRADQDELRRARNLLVILFVLSLLGFPAPVTGLAAGIHAWRKRKQLTGLAGTYLAVGYGAAAMGVCYSGIILLLVAGR